MAIKQFGRYYELSVGGTLIKDLNIDFKVIRTDEKDPNTLDLTVKNLNKKHRNEFQAAKDLVVQLAAGYRDKFGVIFLGLGREVFSTHEGTTWNTTISSGDGEKGQNKGRVNQSFVAGTSFATVLKEVGAQMPGISKGNLDEMASRGTLPGGSKEFVNGVTVSGNTSKEFNRLIKSAGMQWSVQEGKIQVLEATKALNSEAVVLTPDTGLIGSPTISSDGTLNFTCLMNSDIIPGKQVQVKSAHVDGFFKVKRAEYDGDYEGSSWYVIGEAKELKVA